MRIMARQTGKPIGSRLSWGLEEFQRTVLCQVFPWYLHRMTEGLTGVFLCALACDMASNTHSSRIERLRVRLTREAMETMARAAGAAGV